MAVLALTWYGDGEEPSEPVVVRGTCAMGQKRLENAGKAFWEQHELPLCSGKSRKGAGHREETENGDKGDRVDSPSDKAKERKAKRDREQKSKDGGLLKMSEELQGKDLYELLEVEPAASTEDIKKSYRKLVLVHHPDKIQDPTEVQRKHFLLVQEAFEILSDTQKRRRYESTLEFDDWVPTDYKKSDGDFFKKFQPVFKRNARWSARTGVPDLGDESTPIEEVKSFYEFWSEFESWRDPLAMADPEDLYCLEEAECREEKRWMERENGKIGKKIKQEERQRILDFVKLAEKHDPRVVAHRESQRLAKEEEKARKAAAKEAERRKQEEEARAKQEEEEAIRQAEEAKRQAERKVKEEQKQVVKNARQRLRGMHKNAQAALRRAVHVDQLQEVCLQLSADELNELSSSCEALLAKQDASSAVELLHTQMIKCGLTPVEDSNVKVKAGGDTASTGSPDSGNDEDSYDGEDSEAAHKAVKVKTPEELEAERRRREEAEAAEAERQARRAEEQRKKKEQQKKQEEQRMAALRKEEAKQKKQQEKEKAKQQQRIEDEQRKHEEQRQRKIQQAEDQRLEKIRQEEERKRKEEEAIRADAFVADRSAKLDLLEGEDGPLASSSDLGATIQQALLSSASAAATKAWQAIASQLPAAEAIKPPKAPDASLPAKKKAAAQKAYQEEKAAADAAEQARREAEETCLDSAMAHLVQEGNEASDELAQQLAGVLVIGTRPVATDPEVPKEIKPRIKKQRLRLRTAVLRLLRQVEVDTSPVAPAKEGPAATLDKAAIKAGTTLIVIESGPIFESASSYDTIAQAKVDQVFKASGAPVEVDGFAMVPLRPSGTVERRLVRVVPKDAASDKTPIKAGTTLVVIESGPIFASADSYDAIAQAEVDQVYKAAGPPVEVDGFPMVPLRPSGTVERRVVCAIAKGPR